MICHTQFCGNFRHTAGMHNSMRQRYPFGRYAGDVCFHRNHLEGTAVNLFGVANYVHQRHHRLFTGADYTLNSL